MQQKTKAKQKSRTDAAGTIRAVQSRSEAPGAIIEQLHGNSIEYWKNRTYEAIEQYKQEYNYSDSELELMKQLKWNSVLEYIGENVIKTLNIDIRNIDIMNSICTIYLSICRMYLKTSSIYGYSLISCVPYSTLLSYKNGNTYSVYIDIDNDYTEIESKSINVYRMHHKNNRILELSNTYYSGMIKRISADREHGLTDKTEDGSIPSLALGKIEFGWIESAKEKIQVQEYEKYRLPTDIIKELTDN